ncbi:MAG: 4'-phosphopantetheinyl transferase superfamily protein [Candidatus Omnitrophota bacterium]
MSAPRSSRRRQACPASGVLGVDLVEFERAGEFYRSNKNCLGDFLSRSEKRFVDGSSRPHEALALLLAAKEAVFKALDLPWMGTEGFKAIRIGMRPGALKASFRLGAGLSGRLDRKVPRVLFFKKTNRFVVAAFAAKSHEMETAGSF